MIQVKNLSLKIDNEPVFDNLSFEIDGENTYAIFLGKGKGKTSLGAILCGALESDGGEILIDGKKLTSDNLDIKRTIGFYSSDISLLDGMNVLECLEFFGASRGETKDKIRLQAEEALELTELEKFSKHSVFSLDSFSLAKLGIAASLMGKPSLLIYDDIFKGLKSGETDEIAELLKLISQKKHTVLICGSPRAAAKFCTHAIFIENGKVVLSGSIEEIEREINKTCEMSLSVRGDKKLIESSLSEMPEIVKVLVGEERDGAVSVKIEYTEDDKIKDKLFDAMSRISSPILSYEEKRLSIEDVFYSVVKNKDNNVGEKEKK